MKLTEMKEVSIMNDKEGDREREKERGGGNQHGLFTQLCCCLFVVTRC